MKCLFGMFVLMQLEASSNLYVNKREAKCTLLIVRHLLLLVHYLNRKFETFFFC